MIGLYEYEGRAIIEQDFVDALRRVGVVEGDTIFVHSDIKVFGKIGVDDKATLLRSLVHALQKSVGSSGTLVMPTFSYSFCKNEIYDVHATRSTVGALTDFFRSQEGVHRSVHPIFSVAAWGKHANEFMQTSKDSFGEGTSFDTLHRLGGKIVFLGTDFRSCTFLHHVEQMHQVPYRFMKTFEGTIVDGDTTYHDAYTYFVRPLDGTIDNDFTVIEPRLRDAGALRETTVGAARIMSVAAKKLYDEAMYMLDSDQYSFMIDPGAHA
jgi:aminoglycoside 3-N-acetyltransferase